MIDHDNVQEILAAVATRRDARRQFLKVAGSGTAAVGGLALLSACGAGDDGRSIALALLLRRRRGARAARVS